MWGTLSAKLKEQRIFYSESEMQTNLFGFTTTGWFGCTMPSAKIEGFACAHILDSTFALNYQIKMISEEVSFIEHARMIVWGKPLIFKWCNMCQIMFFFFFFKCMVSFHSDLQHSYIIEFIEFVPSVTGIEMVIITAWLCTIPFSVSQAMTVSNYIQAIFFLSHQILSLIEMPAGKL